MVMLFFYLIDVLPNGLFFLLGGILGQKFQVNVYLPIQEMFAFLCMIVGNMNFVFLISMSCMFRKIFLSIFWPRRNHSTNPVMTSLS